MSIMLRRGKQPSGVLPVVSMTSDAFRRGYEQAMTGTNPRVKYAPRELTIVLLVRNLLNIYEDDGFVEDEQLYYECGLLTGWLRRTEF